MKTLPVIAILGASGLIGAFVASQLAREGFAVVPIARRFTRAQRAAFGPAANECQVVSMSSDALAKMFTESRVEIVVNCIGILQDGHRDSTDGAHRAFTARLVAALESMNMDVLLIHLSIPGNDADDATPFSRTKREAEQAILAGTVAHLILRPGFVMAPTAYGGSALMRALAALPFDLPASLSERPFAATDAADIAGTIAIAARRWQDGAKNWRTVWDVMERSPSTVGSVIDALRQWLGGPQNRMTLPGWLMALGARAGDLVAYLGWLPPIRSTALQELRRGVAGDPQGWIAATGIEPPNIDSILHRLPASVQEKWFARLYLAKALILVSLALFWIVSGLIALTLSFQAASAILTSHGFTPALAAPITAVSSLADIAVGLAISARHTCRAGLLAGIALSLFYLASAAIITPDLWLEPLGALFKTGPAIVLMLVALATLENR